MVAAEAAAIEPEITPESPSSELVGEMAERGGFEPPVQALYPYNRLAICPIQPL